MVTHPHTVAVIVILFLCAAGSVIVVCIFVEILLPLFPGIDSPTAIADRMWITHNNQGITADSNKDAAIPKINDGPALLQKPNILLASFVESSPPDHAVDIACAPTG